MKSPRSLPFPGYPTTKGTAQALVIVASLLAAVLMLGGLGALASGIGEAIDFQNYKTAPRCSSPSKDECRYVRAGVVEDARVMLPGLRGEHYEVQVRLTDDASVVTASSSGKFIDSMSKGDDVSVTYWRGNLTQVQDHDVILSTRDDPGAAALADLVGGAIFTIFGVAAFVRYALRPMRDLRSGKFDNEASATSTAATSADSPAD